MDPRLLDLLASILFFDSFIAATPGFLFFGLARHMPAHARFHPRDVLLWRMRNIGKRRVPRIQVREMRGLISDHRAAIARMIGPAAYAWFEECAIDDQLPAPFEHVQQSQLAVRSLE